MLKTMRVAQGNLSELAFFTYMDWEAHMNGQEYGARNSDVTWENRRSMDKLKIRRFPFPQMGRQKKWTQEARPNFSIQDIHGNMG